MWGICLLWFPCYCLLSFSGSQDTAGWPSPLLWVFISLSSQQTHQPSCPPDVRALTSVQPNQRNAQCEANKRELILKTLCTTKKPMNAGSVLLKQLQYKHIFFISVSPKENRRECLPECMNMEATDVSFKSRSIHQRLFWTYLLIKFDQCLSSALHDDAFNEKLPLALLLIEDSEERWSVVIFWSVQGRETFFSNGHKLGN